MGMGAILQTILNCLYSIEYHKLGFVPYIDLDKDILFYEGGNVWEYYFKQICDIKPNDKIIDYVEYGKKHNLFLYRNGVGYFNFYDMDDIRIKEGRSLVKKYFVLKDSMVDDINKFSENWNNVLGVHIRGTDKEREIGKVCLDKYIEAIDKVKNNYEKIFLCTDDETIFQAMSEKYNVIYTTSKRSKDKGVHFSGLASPYELGYEAIRDMVLLSRCQSLICGKSNFSNMAILFGEKLFIIDI